MSAHIALFANIGGNNKKLEYPNAITLQALLAQQFCHPILLPEYMC